MRSGDANSTVGSRIPHAVIPKVLRSRRTNDPFAELDLHSVTGRRIRDLYFGFLEALPSPVTAIMQAQAMAAAEAVVIAEQARQRVLQGDKRAPTYDDLVRLDAQADRKVRRLGIFQPRKHQSELERLWQEADGSDA